VQTGKSQCTRDENWFAVQVRCRCEKTVEELLQGKGYTTFLPLFRCRKRRGKRLETRMEPLFSGYVFCRFNPVHRLPILKTPGLIRIVGGQHGPTPVDDDELSALLRVQESGAIAEPWPFLRVGDRVHISEGPLSGLEGIIVEFKSQSRLVLGVTLLQRSISVQIDGDSSDVVRLGRPSDYARTQPSGGLVSV
jgi:transcriptional antiterminator NusG